MFMVWTCDLPEVIAALVGRKVNIDLFSSIEGNVYGDFIVRVGEDTTYLVKHNTFEVYVHEGNWSTGHWKKI